MSRCAYLSCLLVTASFVAAATLMTAPEAGGGEPAGEVLYNGIELPSTWPPKLDKLTSIQATVLVWQKAWNARDLAGTMRCYTAANRLRRQYGSSPEARARLQEQLNAFPGKLSLAIQKIEYSRSFGADAEPVASVTVLLAISVPGHEDDRRTATMKFAKEDGEWLIQEEGF